MKERQKEIDEGRITGFFDKDTEIKGDLKFKHFLGLFLSFVSISLICLFVYFEISDLLGMYCLIS